MKLSKGEKAKEIALKISKGLISTIPIAGGVAAELFDLVVVPPLRKRQEEWVNSVSQKLVELQSRLENFKIEELVENQLFISTVMKTTSVAMKNHQAVKLDSLRNLLAKTISETNVEEGKIELFVNLVDELTIWHLKVLFFLNDPLREFEKRDLKPRQFSSMAYKGTLLNDLYPELNSDDDFLRLIMRDLYSKTLITNQEILNTTVSPHSVLDSCTTKIGKEFVSYVVEEM